MEARRVPSGGGNQQQQVVGYVDCGIDSEGTQIVIYVPAVMIIEVRVVTPAPGGVRTATADFVTLTTPTKELSLNAEHSKVFLEKIGLRQPETAHIVIPDTAARFGGN